MATKATKKQLCLTVGGTKEEQILFLDLAFKDSLDYINSNPDSNLQGFVEQHFIKYYNEFIKAYNTSLGTDIAEIKTLEDFINLAVSLNPENTNDPVIEAAINQSLFQVNLLIPTVSRIQIGIEGSNVELKITRDTFDRAAKIIGDLHTPIINSTATVFNARDTKGDLSLWYEVLNAIQDNKSPKQPLRGGIVKKITTVNQADADKAKEVEEKLKEAQRQVEEAKKLEDEAIEFAKQQEEELKEKRQEYIDRQQPVEEELDEEQEEATPLVELDSQIGKAVVSMFKRLKVAGGYAIPTPVQVSEALKDPSVGDNLEYGNVSKFVIFQEALKAMPERNSTLIEGGYLNTFNTSFYLDNGTETVTLATIVGTILEDEDGGTKLHMEIRTTKGNFQGNDFNPGSGGAITNQTFTDFDQFITQFKEHTLTSEIVKEQKERNKEETKRLRNLYITARNKHLTENGRVVMYSGGALQGALSPFASDAEAKNTWYKNSFLKALMERMRHKDYKEFPIDLTNLKDGEIPNVKKIEYKLEMRGNNDYRLMVYATMTEGEEQFEVLIGNFDPKKVDEKNRSESLKKFYAGLDATAATFKGKTGVQTLVISKVREWLPKYFNFNPDTDKVEAMGSYPIHPLYQDMQKYGTRIEDSSDRSIFILSRTTEGNAGSMLATQAEIDELQKNWSTIVEKFNLTKDQMEVAGVVVNTDGSYTLPKKPKQGESNADYTKFNQFLKQPKKLTVQAWTKQMKAMGYGVTQVFVSTTDRISRVRRLFNVGGVRGNAVVFYSPFYNSEVLDEIFSSENPNPQDVLYALDKNSNKDDTEVSLEKQQVTFKPTAAFTEKGEQVWLEANFTRDLARKFGINVMVLEAKPVSSSFLKGLMSLFVADPTKTLSSRLLGGAESVYPGKQAFNYKQSFYLHYKLLDILIRDGGKTINLEDKKTEDLLATLFDPSDKYYTHENLSKVIDTFAEAPNDSSAKGLKEERIKFIYREAAMTRAKLKYEDKGTGTDTDNAKAAKALLKPETVAFSDESLKFYDKVFKDAGKLIIFKFTEVNGNTEVSMVFDKNIHPLYKEENRGLEAKVTLKGSVNADNVTEAMLKAGVFKKTTSMDGKFENYQIQQGTGPVPMPFHRGKTKAYLDYAKAEFNKYKAASSKAKFEMSNALAIRLFGYDEHMTIKAANDSSISISKDRENIFNLVQHKKNLGEMNTTPTSELFGTITVASLGLDGSRGERMDVDGRRANQEIWSRHLDGGIQSNDLLEFLKVAVENPTFTQLWDAGNVQRQKAGEYGTDPQVGIKYNPTANLDTGNKNVQVKTIVKTSAKVDGVLTDIVLDQFEVSSVPSYLHVIADIDKREGTIRNGLEESDEALDKIEAQTNVKLTPEEQDAKYAGYVRKQNKTRARGPGSDLLDSRLDDRLLPPVSYDKSVTELRKILQSTFGSYYSEDLLQTFTDKTGVVDGLQLLGWYKNTFIGLHTEAGKGSSRVLRHEMFHKIVDQFLSPEERIKLFAEGRLMYAADTRPQYSKAEPTTKQVEEYLADMYEDTYGDYKSTYWTAVRKTGVLDFADKVLGKNNFVYKFFKGIRSVYLSLVGDASTMTRISDMLTNKIVQYEEQRDSFDSELKPKQEIISAEEFTQLETDLLFEFGDTTILDKEKRRTSGQGTLLRIKAKLNSEYINKSYFTVGSLFSLKHSPATIIQSLNDGYKKELFGLISNQELLQDYLPNFSYDETYSEEYLNSYLKALEELKTTDNFKYNEYLTLVSQINDSPKKLLDILIAVSKRENYNKLVKLMFNDIVDINLDEGDSAELNDTDQDLGFDIITKDRPDIAHSDTVSKKTKRILHGLTYTKGDKQYLVDGITIQKTIEEIVQEAYRLKGSDIKVTTRDVRNLLRKKIKSLGEKDQSQQGYHYKALLYNLFETDIKNQDRFSLAEISRKLDTTDEVIKGLDHYFDLLDFNEISQQEIIEEYNKHLKLKGVSTVNIAEFLELEESVREIKMTEILTNLLKDFVIPLNIKRNNHALAVMLSQYNASMKVGFNKLKTNIYGATSSKVFEARDQSALAVKSNVIQKLIDTKSTNEQERYKLTEEAKKIIGVSDKEYENGIQFIMTETGFTLRIPERSVAQKGIFRTYEFNRSQGDTEDGSFNSFIPDQFIPLLQATPSAKKGEPDRKPLSNTDLSTMLQQLGYSINADVIDGYLSDDPKNENKLKIIRNILEGYMYMHNQYWSTEKNIGIVEQGGIGINERKLNALIETPKYKPFAGSLKMMYAIGKTKNDVVYEQVIGSKYTTETINDGVATVVMGWSPTRDRDEVIQDLLARYADETIASKADSANIGGNRRAFNQTMTPVMARIQGLINSRTELDSSSVEEDSTAVNSQEYEATKNKAKELAKTENISLREATMRVYKEENPYMRSGAYTNALFRVVEGVDGGLMGYLKNSIVKNLRVLDRGYFNLIENTRTAKSEDFSKLSVREIMNQMINGEFLHGGKNGFGSYFNLANRNMRLLLENVADRNYGVLTKVNNKVFYDYEGKDNSLFGLGDQAEYEYMNIYAGELLYVKNTVKEVLAFYETEKYADDAAGVSSELAEVNRLLDLVERIDQELEDLTTNQIKLASKQESLRKLEKKIVDGKLVQEELERIEQKGINKIKILEDGITSVNTAIPLLQNEVETLKVQLAQIDPENVKNEKTEQIQEVVKFLIENLPKVDKKAVKELNLRVDETARLISELNLQRDLTGDTLTDEEYNKLNNEIEIQQELYNQAKIGLDKLNDPLRDKAVLTTLLSKSKGKVLENLVFAITSLNLTIEGLDVLKTMGGELSDTLIKEGQVVEALKVAQAQLEIKTESLPDLQKNLAALLAQQNGSKNTFSELKTEALLDVNTKIIAVKADITAITGLLESNKDVNLDKDFAVKKNKKDKLDILSNTTKELLTAHNALLVSSYKKGHAVLGPLENGKHINKKRKPDDKGLLINEALSQSIYASTEAYINRQKAILIRGLLMAADELAPLNKKSSTVLTPLYNNFATGVKEVGGTKGVNDRYNNVHEKVVDPGSKEEIERSVVLSPEQLQRFNNKFKQYNFVFKTTENKIVSYNVGDKDSTSVSTEAFAEGLKAGTIVQLDALTFLMPITSVPFEKGTISHMTKRNDKADKYLQEAVERVFTGKSTESDIRLMDAMLNQFHPAVTDFFMSHNINQHYLNEYLQGSSFQFFGSINDAMIDRAKRNGTVGTGSTSPTHYDRDIMKTAPHRTVTTVNFNRDEIDLAEDTHAYFADGFYDAYAFDINFREDLVLAFGKGTIEFNNEETIKTIDALRGSHNKIYKFAETRKNDEGKNNLLSLFTVDTKGVLTLRENAVPTKVKPSGGKVGKVKPLDGISNYSFLFWLQLQSGYGYDEGRNVSAKALKMIIDDRNTKTNEVFAMKSLQMVLTSSNVYKANDSVKNLMRTSLEVGVLDIGYPDVTWDATSPETIANTKKKVLAAELMPTKAKFRKKTLYDVYWENGGWFPNENGVFDKVGFSATGIAVESASAMITRSELAVFNAWKDNTESNKFMFLDNRKKIDPNNSDSAFVTREEFINQTGITGTTSEIDEKINEYLKNNKTFSRMDGASIINYSDSIKKGGSNFNEMPGNNTKINVLLKSNTNINALGDIVQLNKEEKEDSEVTTPTQLLYNLGTMLGNYKTANKIYKFMGRISEQQRNKITRRINNTVNDIKNLSKHDGLRKKITNNITDTLLSSNTLLRSIPKKERIVDIVNKNGDLQPMLIVNVEQLTDKHIKDQFIKLLVEREYNRIATVKYGLDVINNNKISSGEYDLITELSDTSLEDLSKISLSNPILFSSIFAEVAAAFSKGIVLKSHGKKALQVPGEDYIDLIDYRGRQYMKPEFVKMLMRREGISHTQAYGQMMSMLQSKLVSTRSLKYAYVTSINKRKQIYHTEIVGANPLEPYYKFLKNVELNEMFEIGKSTLLAGSWDQINDQKLKVNNFFQTIDGKLSDVLKPELENSVKNSFFYQAQQQDKQEQIDSIQEQLKDIDKIKLDPKKTTNFVEKVTDKLENKKVSLQESTKYLQDELDAIELKKDPEESGKVSPAGEKILTKKEQSVLDYSKRINKNREDLNKVERKLKRIKSEGSDSQLTIEEETEELRTNLKALEETIGQITRQELTTYVERFNKALYGVASRIPNTGKNSNTFYKIVGFSTDYGNAVFTPSGWLFISGSDYDGDTLQMWMYHPKGKNKDSDTALDLARQVLTDEANAAEILSELDESMEVLGERARGKFKSQYLKLKPGDLWSWVQIHQQNAIGKLGVGAMALLGKHYAYASQAIKKLADYLLMEKAMTVVRVLPEVLELEGGAIPTKEQLDEYQKLKDQQKIQIEKLKLDPKQLASLASYVRSALPQFFDEHKGKIKSANGDRFNSRNAKNIVNEIAHKLESYVNLSSFDQVISIDDLIENKTVTYLNESEETISTSALQAFEVELTKTGGVELVEEFDKIKEYITEYQEYMKTVKNTGVMPIDTGYATMELQIQKFVIDNNLMKPVDVPSVLRGLKTPNAQQYLEFDNISFFKSELRTKGDTQEVIDIIEEIEGKLTVKVDGLIKLINADTLSTYEKDNKLTRNVAEDLDMDGQPIRQWIESLIQSAVDNAKHMTLGASNITLDNANIQSAMTFLGIPKKLIMDFFGSKAVLDVLKEYKLETDISQDRGTSLVAFLKGKLGKEADNYLPEVMFGENYNNKTAEEILGLEGVNRDRATLGFLYALSKYSEDYADIAGALQPTYAIKGIQEDAEAQLKKILKAYNVNTPEALSILLEEIEDLEKNGESLYVHPAIYNSLVSRKKKVEGAGNAHLTFSHLVGLSFPHIKEMLKAHLAFHKLKHETHFIYSDLGRKVERLTDKFLDYVNSTRPYYKGAAKKIMYRATFNKFMADTNNNHDRAAKYEIKDGKVVQTGSFNLNNLAERTEFKTHMETLVLQLNTSTVSGADLRFIRRLKNENGIISFIEAASMKANAQALSEVRSEFAALGTVVDEDSIELKKALFQYLMIVESYGLEFSKTTYSRFLDKETMNQYNEFLAEVESKPSEFFTNEFVLLLTKELAGSYPGLVRRDEGIRDKETYVVSFINTPLSEDEIFAPNVEQIEAGRKVKRNGKWDAERSSGDTKHAKEFHHIQSEDTIEVDATIGNYTKNKSEAIKATFATEFASIITDPRYNERFKLDANGNLKSLNVTMLDTLIKNVNANVTSGNEFYREHRDSIIKTAFAGIDLSYDVTTKDKGTRTTFINMDKLYSMYVASGKSVDELQIMLEALQEPTETTTTTLKFDPEEVAKIADVQFKNETFVEIVNNLNSDTRYSEDLRAYNLAMTTKAKNKTISEEENADIEALEEKELEASEAPKLPALVRYSQWNPSDFTWKHRIFMSVVESVPVADTAVLADDQIPNKDEQTPETEEKVVYKRLYRPANNNINLSGVGTMETTDTKGQRAIINMNEMYFNDPASTEKDIILTSGVIQRNSLYNNKVSKALPERRNVKHRLKRNVDMEGATAIRSKLRLKMLVELLAYSKEIVVVYISSSENYNPDNVGYMKNGVLYIDLNKASVKHTIQELYLLALPSLVREGWLNFDSIMTDEVMEKANTKIAAYATQGHNISLDDALIEIFAGKDFATDEMTSNNFLQLVVEALNSSIPVNSLFVDDILQDSVKILQEQKLSPKENQEVLSLLPTNTIAKQSTELSSETISQCNK